MSSPPPKKGEADPEVVQSPQEDQEPSSMEHPGQDPGHEVEVKEQDRWLPIANGEYSYPLF